jgi:hypothetical protein
MGTPLAKGGDGPVARFWENRNLNHIIDFADHYLIMKKFRFLESVFYKTL